MGVSRIGLGLVLAIGLANAAHAADAARGKAIADAVCAACHGATGVSVHARFPNLAAQRAGYVEKQLKAFKSQKRKHPMMSPLAAKLGPSEMKDLAAYFAGQPGPAVGAPNAKPPAQFIAKRVSLPSDLSGFTHYMTFNHKGRKQLRKVYADKIALDAARGGRDLPDGSILVVEAFKAKMGPDKKPIVGSDGFYVADGRAGFTAMERRAGWGNDFHPAIRNGNWHYGVYKPDGSPRPNINQATCLACHLPHAKDSYIFSMEQLRAAARN